MQRYDYHENPLPPPGGGFSRWLLLTVVWIAAVWFGMSLLAWIFRW